jgi:transposase
MSAAAATVVPAEKLGRDAARRRVSELQTLLAQAHEGCAQDAVARKAADDLIPHLRVSIADLETQLLLPRSERAATSPESQSAPACDGPTPEAQWRRHAAAATAAQTLSRDAARQRVIELEKHVAPAAEECAREAAARKVSDDLLMHLQARVTHLEALRGLKPEERVAYLDRKLMESEHRRAEVEARYAQQDALLKDVQHRYARLEELIKTAAEDNADLRYKLENLLRDLHTPKSEKLTAARRKKFGLPEKPKDSTPEQGKPVEAAPSDPAQSPSSDKEAENKPTKRKRPPNSGGRRARETGPMRVLVVQPTEQERKGKIFLRNEVSIKDGYEPAHGYQLMIIRPIYVSPDGSEPPVIAPMPPEAQVIPKSNVLVDMVVRIIIGKYQKYEPLYRQEEIDKHAGIVISRSARCRYVEEIATLLKPIYEVMEHRVVRSFYIVIDETFLKVLDSARKGAAGTAYLWGFYAPYEDVVIMKFSTSRDAKIVLEVIPPDWPGVMHSDGYSGYPYVASQRSKLIHVECMNHLRRYVLKAVKAGHKEAIPLLEQIQTLYKIEAEAREQDLTPYAREQLRQAKARPVLEALEKGFFELLNRKEPLMGRLKEAVTYATNRWDHLKLYAEPGYGFIEIDQTAIERLWRPEKLGLKNYLFIGHEDAGWRSAVIYSIIETCKMVGVDPEEYLLWVLPKLAMRPRTGPPEPRAKGLLPHDFKKLKEAKVAKARPRPAPPQHPDNPFCSARPFAGHRQYRKAHRTRDGSVLAA